jgi:Glycosyltransferase family 87
VTLSPTLRRFFIVFAVVAAAVAGKRVADSYEEREFYRKDFLQEYVLARAVLAGVYPYAPMPEMAARFNLPPNVPWAHPTPHTPVAAILSVPIGLFAYPVAVTIWLVLELLCIALAVELLARAWGEPVPLLAKITLFLMSLATGPVLHELWFGQFGSILLVLLTLAWLNLRAGRDEIGGALLGLSIALKLTAWPIALFLLLMNRWRAIVPAVGVIALLNFVAVLALGSTTVQDYWYVVGPRIAADYARHDENFSLWTVIPRLFSAGGVEGIGVANHFVAMPLDESPTTQPILRYAFLLPATAFLGAMWLARHCRSFDSAYGILLCASLPINPVVWDHYLMLAAIPIVIVFSRLRDAGFPRGRTALALVSLGLTILPGAAYLTPALRASVGEINDKQVLPFLAGLVTYVPLLPLAGWIGLLAATDGETATGS